MTTQGQTLSEDRLRKLLLEYFLPHGPRKLTDAIHKISLAYLYGEYLELPNNHYLSEDMESVVKALGITYGCYTDVTDMPPLDVDRILPSRRGLLIDIKWHEWPDLDDLPAILSTCFQASLADFRSRSPLDIKGVGALFLLWLMLYASDDQRRMRKVVRNALLSHRNDYVDNSKLEIVGLGSTVHHYHELHLNRCISKALLNYIGCDTKSSWIEEPSPWGHRRDPDSDVVVDDGDEPIRRHYPLAQPLRCDVYDIHSVVSNICHFIKNPDAKPPPKVIQCLESRLQRKQEDEIRTELGFSNSQDYQAWLESNHINKSANVPDTSYDDWMEARKILLSGDWRILSGAATIRVDADNSSDSSSDRIADSTVECRRSDEFRHSPDFRTVWVGEQEYVLNDREARAIKFLHKRALEGYPNVDRYDLINEACGEKSSVTLVRDIFASRETYPALVEKKGKGLYRLKANLVRPED